MIVETLHSTSPAWGNLLRRLAEREQRRYGRRDFATGLSRL